MMETLQRADVLVVLIYMALVILIGWWVSEGSNDAEGYTVGNRNMPGWLVGISVIGAYVSSITFLAVPAKTYSGNWNPFVFALTLPLAALIAVPTLVPFYRKYAVLSVYEVLERRFGYWARLYANLSFLALQLLRIASIEYLVALAVRPLLGWELSSTIMLLGVVVIVYDVMGGIKAVIWTDVMQVFLLVGGAIWCLAVLFADLPTGLSYLYTEIDRSKFSLGEWYSRDPRVDTFFVMFLYGLTENLRNLGTDQNYIQRMFCSSSNREASKSLWIGALCYVPVSAMFCFIGTALFAFYTHHPDRLVGEGGAVIQRADEIFPHFIRTELSKPVAGLVIAAILSAAMSTIDSNLNAMSTVFLADVVRRFRRGPARIPEILILRATTVVSGTVAAWLAVRIAYRDDLRVLFDIWMQYCGTIGGGLLGLFILAWLMPRVPAWSAAIALAVSLPFLMWGTFLRNLAADSPWKGIEFPFHANLVGVVGTAALVAVGAGFALAVRLGWVGANPRHAVVQTATSPLNLD